MRRGKDSSTNRVADPVVSDFDVLRTVVYRVVEIDQSDSALVVDAEVDRVVSDEFEFLEEGA